MRGKKLMDKTHSTRNIISICIDLRASIEYSHTMHGIDTYEAGFACVSILLIFDLQ